MDITQKIINTLHQAGIIALPTDTVYGLAIDPYNKLAVQKLYRLKQRDAHKPLVYMIADKNQLPDLVYNIDPATQKIIDQYWPGALTIIFKNHGGNGTIGIRIPDHTLMLDLLSSWGKPLAVTSANLSGEPELTSLEAIKQKFGQQIDLYIDNDRKISGKASTIIDVSNDTIKVLRQGDITI